MDAITQSADLFIPLLLMAHPFYRLASGLIFSKLKQIVFLLADIAVLLNII